MTEENRKGEVIVAVPKKQSTREQSLFKRAERAELCLGWLLSMAKAQIDPATRLNLGFPEAEAFLEALANGRQHPLSKLHQKRARKQCGKPSAPLNEQYARRYIIQGCFALEKAGLSKTKARERMIKGLKNPPLFPETPSADMLENWQRRMMPLTPADQAFVADGLDRCGANLDAIADHFIGRAHSILNPDACAVIPSKPPV